MSFKTFLTSIINPTANLVAAANAVAEATGNPSFDSMALKTREIADGLKTEAEKLALNCQTGKQQANETLVKTTKDEDDKEATTLREAEEAFKRATAEAQRLRDEAVTAAAEAAAKKIADAEKLGQQSDQLVAKANRLQKAAKFFLGK